jgi:hypothetical protein
MFSFVAVHWLIYNSNTVPAPHSSPHGLIMKTLEATYALKYLFGWLPKEPRCLQYLTSGPRY